MEFFQAIDALLDVLDATGTVVGLMALWYTWVVPPRIAPETVTLDVEHFLQAVAVTVPAQSGQPQHSVIVRAPSGQPQQEAGGVPKASAWAADTASDRA